MAKPCCKTCTKYYGQNWIHIFQNICLAPLHRISSHLGAPHEAHEAWRLGHLKDASRGQDDPRLWPSLQYEELHLGAAAAKLRMFRSFCKCFMICFGIFFSMNFQVRKNQQKLPGTGSRDRTRIKFSWWCVTFSGVQCYPTCQKTTSKIDSPFSGKPSIYGGLIILNQCWTSHVVSKSQQFIILKFSAVSSHISAGQEAYL